MSVKTITITEDAYTRLAALKIPGESFSEVVRRIAGKSSLMDLAGVLNQKEADTLESTIKKIRKNINTRLTRVAQDFK